MSKYKENQPQFEALGQLVDGATVYVVVQDGLASHVDLFQEGAEELAERLRGVFPGDEIVVKKMKLGY